MLNQFWLFLLFLLFCNRVFENVVWWVPRVHEWAKSMQNIPKIYSKNHKKLCFWMHLSCWFFLFVIVNYCIVWYLRYTISVIVLTVSDKKTFNCWNNHLSLLHLKQLNCLPVAKLQCIGDHFNSALLNSDLIYDCSTYFKHVTVFGYIIVNIIDHARD